MQTESLRRRIDNVESLQSIVTTMKALAAINIRQYERAVESLADYNRTIELGFQALLYERAEEITPPRSRPHNGVGVIVFGTDQGMCGPFNEQIATFTHDELARLRIPRTRRRMLVMGTRLGAVIGSDSQAQPVDDFWSLPSSIAGITSLIQDILLRIDDWRMEDEVDQVLLFYNHALPGSAYRPHLLHLLPVYWERFRRLARKEWKSRSRPMFTMATQPLLSALLRQYLFVSIYRAFAESALSENASRLATMQAAERNIEEYLEDLNRMFHQQRQQSITEELLDILAGFETLMGDKRTQGNFVSTPSPTT